MRNLRGRAARAVLAALWAVVALATCPAAWAACPDGGIGGTGAVARGGVGGTGISDAPGTVGVVGVITGFASVCVNGLEIHYEPGTLAEINGRPAATAQLALGQWVAVEALSADGRLAARNITMMRVLEGPVTRVDADTTTVFVMGQAVRVTGETVTAAGPIADIAPGTTLQVSGFRNSRGEIVASRLDAGAPADEHSVIGRMAQRDAQSGDVEGLTIALPDARPRGESEVLVRGRWDGERLRAVSVAEAPATRLLRGVDRVVIESLVREARRGDRMRVGEFDVRIDRSTRIERPADALQLDQHVRITGAPDRGGIAAERIDVPRARPVRPGGAERRPEAGVADQERSPAERPEHSDPGSGSGRSERPDRPDNSGPGKPERVERPDKSGSGKPERIERSERSDRQGSNSGKQ